MLRSKSPEMVRQEFWGILLAHYANRALMVEAAHDADLDPDRLSFMQSLRVILREADGSADFPPHSSSDATHRRVIDQILECPLQERRLRAYLRVIKRYGPCYRPIKRPEHHEIRYNGTATIEIRLPDVSGGQGRGVMWRTPLPWLGRRVRRDDALRTGKIEVLHALITRFERAPRG